MSQPVFEAVKREQEATGKLSKYAFCNRDGQPLELKANLFSAEVTWTAALSAGKARSFRPFGSLLRQIDGGDWVMFITLVDSGEVTKYRLPHSLEDPLEP